MKILKLSPLLLSLSCAIGVNQARVRPHRIQRTELEDNVCRVSNFRSEQEALDYLDRRHHPNGFVFGEAHLRRPNPYLTNLQRFALRIVPWLHSKGINDVAIEYLPNSPDLNQTLSTRYSSGTLDQFVYDYHGRRAESCGLTATIETCLNYGMTIYGTHYHRAPHYDIFSNPHLFISTSSLQFIRSSVYANRKFAIFGGWNHFNRYPARNVRNLSVADNIEGLPNARIVHINFLTPPQDTYSSEDPTRNFFPGNLSNYAPTQGVNIVRHPSSEHYPEYSMFFPRETSPFPAQCRQIELSPWELMRGNY